MVRSRRPRGKSYYRDTDRDTEIQQLIETDALFLREMTRAMPLSFHLKNGCPVLYQAVQTITL